MQFKALDLVPRRISPSSLHDLAIQLRGTRLSFPRSSETFVWHGGIGSYPTFVHIDTRGIDKDW